MGCDVIYFVDLITCTFLHHINGGVWAVFNGLMLILWQFIGTSILQSMIPWEYFLFNNVYVTIDLCMLAHNLHAHTHTFNVIIIVLRIVEPYPFREIVLFSEDTIAL